MATLLTRPLRRTLSRGVERLRAEGHKRLVAALAVEPSSPPLPPLRGEELARYHLEAALDAFREPSVSKPESFRKLRLLVNALEQGGVRKKPRSPEADTTTKDALPGEIVSLSSRSRLLLHRAVETAQHLRARQAA